jgi:hypothetical protein
LSMFGATLSVVRHRFGVFRVRLPGAFLAPSVLVACRGLASRGGLTFA